MTTSENDGNDNFKQPNKKKNAMNSGPFLLKIAQSLVPRFVSMAFLVKESRKATTIGVPVRPGKAVNGDLMKCECCERFSGHVSGNCRSVGHGNCRRPVGCKRQRKKGLNETETIGLWKPAKRQPPQPPLGSFHPIAGICVVVRRFHAAGEEETCLYTSSYSPYVLVFNWLCNRLSQSCLVST